MNSFGDVGWDSVDRDGICVETVVGDNFVRDGIEEENVRWLQKYIFSKIYIFTIYNSK